MFCANECLRYPFFGSICYVWAVGGSWRAEFHGQQVGSDSNLQVHKARQWFLAFIYKSACSHKWSQSNDSAGLTSTGVEAGLFSILQGILVQKPTHLYQDV